jgi:hypothetical protein
MRNLEGFIWNFKGYTFFMPNLKTFRTRGFELVSAKRTFIGFAGLAELFRV